MKLHPKPQESVDGLGRPKHVVLVNFVKDDL